MINTYTEQKPKSRFEKIGVLSFFFLIIFGLVMGYILADRTTLSIRSALQSRAYTIASFISSSDLKMLSGTPTDTKNPVYQQMKKQLIGAHAFNEDTRFIYVMGKRDGKLFFYVDSEAPNSVDYSAPGQVYDDAKEVEIEYFDKGVGYVTEAYDDSWGRWVTAYAPIFDANNATPIAQVGIDVSAYEYQNAWRSIFLSTFAICLLVAVFALLFSMYIKKIQKLFNRSISEKVAIEGQKKKIEETNAKSRVGAFMWNRATGSISFPDFLLSDLELSKDSTFEDFKSHISDEENSMLERQILEKAQAGEKQLVCEVNYHVSTGNMRRLRLTCNFRHVFENNPKVIEGTILEI